MVGHLEGKRMKKKVINKMCVTFKVWGVRHAYLTGYALL